MTSLPTSAQGRLWLHGDLVAEEDARRRGQVDFPVYYCAACDLMAPRSHFEGEGPRRSCSTPERLVAKREALGEPVDGLWRRGKWVYVDDPNNVFAGRLTPAPTALR